MGQVRAPSSVNDFRTTENAPRPARRASLRRRLLAFSAALPVVVLALPRLGGPERPSLTARKAERLLQGFWTEYAQAENPEPVDLAAFTTWLVEDDGAARRLEIAPEIQWSIERHDDRTLVRLGLEHGAPPGADAAALVVREQPWSGARFALAAEDLSCVLCHTSVDGDVFSRTAHEATLDETIDVEGERVHGSSEPLFLTRPQDGASARRIDFARVMHVGGQLQGLGDAPPGRAREVRGEGARPFSIDGDVSLDGDVVLVGPYAGRGRLFVDGNVFVPYDLVSDEGGSLVVVATGSVLFGDVLRPRAGEAIEVTGDASGSFSFSVEALARWNGWRIERGLEPLALFPDQSAWELKGTRATGDWFDPALARVLGDARHVLVSRETSSRFPRELGSDHLVIEATLVAQNALIGVAPTSRAFGSAGSISIAGAVIATHAAIHAPRGLEILDDPVARRGLAAAGVGGLVATVTTSLADSDSGHGIDVDH